ncbi:BaiN/RdsA family NAD(P)/FAD-dependent oxidoreductase [Lignipirellula cremea]|uniref:N-methyltryptophan oxidase n=1 Tax=Lignipirellula cremea TaxID=2528010 RepID=A0A518DMB4_9BACT|nr:NAD(P)/FAD-dependent oxidoreductase [Lignipirellula cremea]QDU92975.1 N-methyltryptophan oxidase [Lignipirellula cremea]
MTDHWEVIVIGAGAAGILAATTAAERGKKTLLLEKNRRPGMKILMSGGTRCNITHNTQSRGIVAAFGRQGKFLHSALAALSPQAVIARIEAEGVGTKVEPNGKIFPVSDKAADVLAALWAPLERSGCTFAREEPVQDLVRSGEQFLLRTSLRELTADKVIVTTGGKSYPGSGTQGDGYPWLAELGHTIITPRPALTPITTNDSWAPELKGVAAPAILEVIEPGRKKPLAQRREAVLFTHFGLSGPAVLDVSRAVSGHANPQALRLRCDFFPDDTIDSLDEWLRNPEHGGKFVSGVINQKIIRRLGEAIQTLADVPLATRASELSRKDRRRLVETLKRLEISVSGVRGFKKAEVTAGGVDLAEVDSSTMQSKRVPHLYLAGEILDLDGPIGGYNFQAAFSTGYLAGQSV